MSHTWCFGTIKVCSFQLLCLRKFVSMTVHAPAVSRITLLRFVTTIIRAFWNIVSRRLATPTKIPLPLSLTGRFRYCAWKKKGLLAIWLAVERAGCLVTPADNAKGRDQSRTRLNNIIKTFTWRPTYSTSPNSSSWDLISPCIHTPAESWRLMTLGTFEFSICVTLWHKYSRGWFATPT